MWPTLMSEHCSVLLTLLSHVVKHDDRHGMNFRLSVLVSGIDAALFTDLCATAAAQTSQSSQRKTGTQSDQKSGGKQHSSVSTARTAAAAAAAADANQV